MNEESSVEDEGARCGTQHEWRGWTSRFGRGKASGAARESGRRFGRAGQSLFCLAGKGFEGVEGVGGGAATGESKVRGWDVEVEVEVAVAVVSSGQAGQDRQGESR
jgi:hypothetical protein